ncbi:MAG TPA: hypothetical protein VGM90_30640 [Kofleriaceae bacterium]|jgi:post-segregation antitoxin (ccd killing protein)
MAGPKIEKLSISVPKDVVRGMRAAAGDAGLSISAWVTQAAAAELRRQHLRKFLGELDDEYGPVPAKVSEKVRRDLEEARKAAEKRWQKWRRA